MKFLRFLSCFFVCRNLTASSVCFTSTTSSMTDHLRSHERLYTEPRLCHKLQSSLHHYPLPNSPPLYHSPTPLLHHFFITPPLSLSLFLSCLFCHGNVFVFCCDVFIPGFASSDEVNDADGEEKRSDGQNHDHD